jgi:CHAT domain-containing protein
VAPPDPTAPALENRALTANRRCLIAGWLVAVLCFAPAVGSPPTQDDPGVVQKRAIARLDAFVDHYRRTGDRQSLVPELLLADRELTASNRDYAARGDLSALALGLIKQGHIYRMQAQWDRAIQLYTQAQDVATRARNTVRQTDALAYRALAETSERNPGQALSDATEAVRVGRTIDDQDAFARALDTLGAVQLAQLDLAGAADSLNREVAVAAQGKDPATPYYAHLSRSDVYLKTAERCDYQRSFEPCYEALDRAGADLQAALDIANRLGFAALAAQTEQFVHELETRRSLIQTQEKMHQSLQQVSAFHPKTVANVLLSDKFVPVPGVIPPQLEQLYEQAKREEKQAGGFADGIQASSRFIDGQMNEMKGNNDAALASYLKAIDTLERDRRSLHDDRNRGTFLEDRIGFYYAAILQLLERHRYAEAFQLLERSRSRALADLLASRRLGLDRPQEQTLYSESALIRTRIAEAQSRMFELASQSNSPANGPRLSALQQQIGSLEEQDGRLNSRMAADAPKLHNLVNATPVGLEALQASMRAENYEMLQYLVLESAVIVWHISADSVVVRNVFLPRSEVIVKVAALRRSLSDRNTAFDDTTARELFLYLVAPVLPHIHAQRLVIVPHEDLQYVPFQVFQNPADGQYLGERFQITYAPSASILLGLPPSPGLAGGRLLALADPGITAAPGEVNAIAKLFPGTRKVVTDVLPTKANVKRWVRDYDVIHFSVHGKFDAGEPMLSYLSFGRDGTDDGRLTAAEMFGLPLDKSRLVVLSACETGRAEATHANEILGMVRALLFAGAGTLVLSHWKVDSASTALWMQTFYEAAQARSLPEAARMALVKVKSVPAYNHPYFWAPFSMVGR